MSGGTVFGDRVSVDRIARPDQPFRRDPARSFTLPARFYTSVEADRREKDAIFDRSWFYVGHRSQVADPGSYLTATVYDQEVMVTCDDSGERRAFYNVCRHRGHQLVQGSGQSRALTCPYHAWVYGLDGSLRTARNTAELDGFDRCDFGLVPVGLEDLCGFLFVNLDPSARPLSEQAPELEDELRHFCPEIDSVSFAQRDSYEVGCNWKTLIDNFLECYHCAPAHRDFVDLVDMGSYRSRVKGIYSNHVSNAARTNESSAYSFEPGSVDFGYAGWFLWPNLTIWIYPGDAHVSLLQMLPVPGQPERAIEYQDWFCPGGSPTPQLKEAMVYQKDVLQPEDIGLCESVQRGLRSNGYNQGRFVVDGDLTELSEHTVHHFQLMVAEAMGHPIVD